LVGTTAAASSRRRRSGSAGCSSRNGRKTPRHAVSSRSCSTSTRGRAARRSPDGRYVPLSEQDPALWSRETIAEAEAELAAASSQRQPGRFQIEAAIQSAHAARARGGSIDWRAIALFYDHLVRLSPTVGARVGRAAALAEVEGPVAALTRLDEIGDVSASQPYWAVRAHFLAEAGRAAEARVAYDRAIALATDPAVKRFLSDRRG